MWGRPPDTLAARELGLESPRVRGASRSPLSPPAPLPHAGACRQGAAGSAARPPPRWQSSRRCRRSRRRTPHAPPPHTCAPNPRLPQAAARDLRFPEAAARRLSVEAVLWCVQGAASRCSSSPVPQLLLLRCSVPRSRPSHRTLHATRAGATTAA